MREGYFISRGTRVLLLVNGGSLNITKYDI